jgi:hypothetical protein
VSRIAPLALDVADKTAPPTTVGAPSLLYSGRRAGHLTPESMERERYADMSQQDWWAQQREDLCILGVGLAGIATALPAALCIHETARPWEAAAIFLSLGLGLVPPCGTCTPGAVAGW